MGESGYLTLGSPGGVPVRVHWTAPLGAVVLSGLAWRPGAWVGFLVLILVHELGHAALVKLNRLQVIEVMIHAIGGECRWVGNATEVQRSVVAWGGVLAQALLLVVALVVRQVVGLPSLFVAELLGVWTTTNLMIMGINLIPYGPLDGVQAWKLPGLLKARRARQQRRSHLRVVETPRRDDVSSSAMSESLQREVDRITREAVRDSKRPKN